MSAIRHVGAKPALADISFDFNVNPDSIEKLINKKYESYTSSSSLRTLMSNDYDYENCEKYNLLVIEDGAQSFGAKYKNKFVGTFGKAGCFSLHPLKSLGAAGDGGFVVTNDKSLLKKYID